MTCRPLSSLFRLGLATVVLALLGACAQPVAPSAMVPDVTGINVGPTSVYRGAISVGQVSGGHPPSSLGVSQVSDADLRDALVRTLMDADLSQAGGQTGGGRFQLDAVLQRLEQPYAGFAMTVTATIAYRLTEVATGRVVYDNTITTPATATLNDAIDGNVRLKIANERAIRANLRQLVEALYALPSGR
ncbi:MAG: hypothetical protein J0H77_09540 [Alphaproteobacteria bacterium]|mgnify:CR=1 FL=1|nr:hypothetical protein [Alphaproteobacteria bacterium]